MIDIDQIIRPDDDMPLAFRALPPQQQYRYWHDVLEFAKRERVPPRDAHRLYADSFGLGAPLPEVSTATLLVEVLGTLDDLLDLDGVVRENSRETTSGLLATRRALAERLTAHGLYDERSDGRELADPATLERVDPATVSDIGQHWRLHAERQDQHAAMLRRALALDAR